MKRIGKEELEALKRPVDLLALVRAYGREPQRAGKRYVVSCLLHDESEPSLTLFPESGRWKCFGACTAEGSRGGDAVTLLMLLEGVGFHEVVEALKTWGGGDIASLRSLIAAKRPGSRRGKADPPPPSEAPALTLTAPAATPADPSRAKLLEAVVKRCEQDLAHAPRAQSYLKRRGLLVPEVLQAHRVGYASGSLLKSVAPDSEEHRQLIALGLLSEKGYELMSGMVVVPLLEPRSGAVLNLYGRAITGARHYYLPGERRGLVNGLHALGCEHLILVESVLDALSLFVLGIPNVLPLYGVNGWTKDHDRVLAEGAVKTVTLLLDNDEAGRRAALSRAELLAQRGLAVRITTLPAGFKDPNEALVGGMTGPELRQVLDEALLVASPTSTMLATAPTPPAPAAAMRYELEETAGGFIATMGARRYRATALSGYPQRLDLNLRLDDPYTSYVDSLNLYVGRARRGFLRAVSRCFQLDEEALDRELNLLIEIAESWLAAKARKDEEGTSAEASPELSEAEREEALALLKDPDLLERTVEHMGRLGYVGEEINKALGYLVIVSRKLEEPLSMLVLSQSGAGKSGLTELLERLTPPEDVVLYSRLTANALYYMPKDFLRRKVVVIEERSGSEEADYSLRTLQSRKKLVLGVPIKDPRTGRTRTVRLEVEGPAVFLQTSTALDTNFENSTRCFELYLDESAEQTRRIQTRQRWAKTGPGKRATAELEDLVRLHWNVQRLLRPVEVHIPFAAVLTFPDVWLRTRRDHLRFLNLVEASAFLHQHQRPVPRGSEPGTAVEATVEDYRIAYGLGREVLGSTLAELKKPVREMLVAMDALLAERSQEKKLPRERLALTRRELRERTGLPDLQVWRLLRELVQLEHVEQVSGSNGKLCTYRIATAIAGQDSVLAGLLSPEELRLRLERPS